MFRFNIPDVLWVILVLALMIGCASSASKPRQPDDGAGMQVLRMRVTKVRDHLGHSTSIEGGMSVHPVWCDGCRGHLVDTNEEFVIWWNNNEIRDRPFRFEDGKTYLVYIDGDIEHGVMGFSGKCVHVAKVAKIAEEAI